MLYITNGFSDSMHRDPTVKVVNYNLTKEKFIEIIHHAQYVSIIGHDNLAEYITELTGVKIRKNRRAINLNYDDEVIVFGLQGRLPEHKTEIELNGREIFTYKRFEKQTAEDIRVSEERIRELIRT